MLSTCQIKGLASDWSWYMQLAEAGVTLPVLMFAGPLADKIGRKPLLLWNVTISFVSFVCKTVIYQDQQC
jgi:MFS family permease